MKENFSREFEEITRMAKEQIDNLKQNKDKRWMLLIPIFIPLFCHPLWLLIVTCLAIYFVYASNKNKNQ